MATVDRAVQVHTRRVFLSYKRNVEPDQTLAAEVVAGLETAGYPVFIDRRLTVGQTWAREIETEALDYRLTIDKEDIGFSADGRKATVTSQLTRVVTRKSGVRQSSQLAIFMMEKRSGSWIVVEVR